MNREEKTVFVGLSGGVDSSVAALRLKKAGYNVVGVFIKVWHPEFLVCDWEAERLDAMRVAAHLDIPFLTCDAVDAYKEEVANYFISEYQRGHTPNPDVFCNKAVKFGAFLEFALKRGADFVATGHYATKQKGADGWELVRGVDARKDQSYFLWTLTQTQLDHIMLPVGDTDKSTIRKEADAARIPVATKKDSQGICFLGHIDIPEFLSHYTTLESGDVLDTNGEVIGRHQGALVYTLGQRHGFVIHAKDTGTKPHYVIGKDLEHNTITVDTKSPQAPATTNIVLTGCNWITDAPESESECTAQFYYQQRPVSVRVASLDDTELTLVLNESTRTPAAGQSCVLYQGNVCLGGGIIAA